MAKIEVSIKRARNVIWNAAEDYSFTPVFLAATSDEDINFYLNITVGLVHKWFTSDELDTLFRNMSYAPHQEELEACAWIALEHAVWKKERDKRPALDSLREAYARAELGHFGNQPKLTTAEILQDCQYHAILGQQPAEKLGGREQALWDALLSADASDGTAITAAIKSALFSYYHVNLNHAYARRKRAQKWELTNWVVFDHNAYSLIRNPERVTKDGRNDAAKPGKNGLSKLFQQKFDPDTVRKRIQLFFGDSIYDSAKVVQLEEKLCTGNHSGCHLYYSEGERRESSEEEERLMKESAGFGSARRATKLRYERMRTQRQRNEDFYNDNRLQYQNQIRRLAAMIRNAILTQQADEFYTDRTGLIDSPRAWRGAVLRDPRVFLRKEVKHGGDFCVTFLLDASASQLDHQEVIAAEAYILAEALRLNDIDTQIWSYCSASGFTIMNRLKKLTEGKESTSERNRSVFKYSAMGCNRDGLALRAVRRFIDTDRYRYNLLLVLTDATPNDDDTVPISGRGMQTRAYTGHDGVADTAHEVRLIREDRIRTAGIVYGKDDAVMSAQDIYGTGYARIHSLSNMAKVAGTFIQQEIDEIYNAQ